MVMDLSLRPGVARAPLLLTAEIAGDILCGHTLGKSRECGALMAHFNIQESSKSQKAALSNIFFRNGTSWIPLTAASARMQSLLNDSGAGAAVTSGWTVPGGCAVS